MFDYSEIILYLGLLKKNNKNPTINDLNVMLSSLQNYDEVKMFWNKIKEYKFQPRITFLTGSLIHFIECYDECEKLKNYILTIARRKYGILFIQQIMLSRTRGDAIKIIQEAKDNGVILAEAWAERYDSIDDIKRDQASYSENRKASCFISINQSVYAKFQRMLN